MTEELQGHASKPPEQSESVWGWQKEKPTFTEDCILLTAVRIKEQWDYSLYEIILSSGEDKDGNKSWYWAIFCDDNEEWGDLDELHAQYYQIIKPVNPYCFPKE